MATDPASFLSTIKRFRHGIALNDLLVRHPDTARRTAQRWLNQLQEQGLVLAQGQARARRYLAIKKPDAAAGGDATGSTQPLSTQELEQEDIFPSHIPLSSDSRDILAYVNQPLQARKPVGYQRAFLESYLPNQTWYLPAAMRRQLHTMGNTGQAQRPAGTYGRAIVSQLLIDLSWASSHLEGNTYSRLDTRRLIEQGQAATGKAAVETQMILNHKAAIELLLENIDTVAFDRLTLLNLHSVLAENLMPNPADEGRLRLHGVQISRSVYRPLTVASQVSEYFDLLLEKTARIEDAFEQSFFVMVHLPYLQPFADVNKRTSRLLANLPLLRANLCPLTFLDVPERAYTRAVMGVYELTRIELLRDLYLWAYERSTQEYLVVKHDLTEPDPLRLAHRELIRKTVHEVVTHPEQDPLTLVRRAVNNAFKSKRVNAELRRNVQALLIDELRRLHEGVLARYGLRPSELATWRTQHQQAM